MTVALSKTTTERRRTGVGSTSKEGSPHEVRADVHIRPDLQADPARVQEVYGQVYQWFQDNGASGKIADSGAELHGVETATTVRSGDGGVPVVVDGPFNEAKEIIGGFSVIDVADMDEAIALARTWPPLAFPGVAVEIRPMVDDYSQFE